MSLASDRAKSLYDYDPPTVAGKIPFTPPGTDFKCGTAYWLWGDLKSKLPPLIILHGGPGAPGRDWQPISALQKKHGIPVVLYDQIGCGESTHLRNTRGDTKFWTMELFLAELDNLRKYLEIETFDLLGHSCGAQIAVSYTLTQPRGLRKLIIASASASDELRRKSQIEQRTQLPQDMQETLARCERDGTTDDPKYGMASFALMQRMLCRMDPWPQEVQDVISLMMEDDTVQHTLFGASSVEPTGP